MEPSVLGDPERRQLYLSQELASMIQGPWTNKEERARYLSLRADFDAFTTSRTITVARRPRAAKPAALLAQLEKPQEEVWEIRSVAPDPSLRIFGRFAGRDTFVALRWQYRAVLGAPGSPEWEFLIRVCQHDWRTLFHSFPPHTGSYPYDYISGAIFDRDR